MWIHWVLSGCSARIGCLFLALWPIRQCSYPRNSKTHSSAIKFDPLHGPFLTLDSMAFSPYFSSESALCIFAQRSQRYVPYWDLVGGPTPILCARATLDYYHQCKYCRPGASCFLSIRDVIFPEAGQGRISNWIECNMHNTFHNIWSCWFK